MNTPVSTSVPASATVSTTNSSTPMTTPATENTAIATQAEQQYEISPGVFVDKETYDIIKGADQKAIRPTRNLIPEIKIVSTDKQVLDFQNILGVQITKGNFVKITYNQDGEKIYELMPATFQAVILKNTNAYSLYDEVEGKSTFYTNEFEYGVQNRAMLKRDDDKKIFFDGAVRDLKEFLLAHFPGKATADGRKTHQFSFRNIIYISIPDLIKDGDGTASVFRLLLSHTSLDGINAFKDTISGDPMKYLAEFSTTPKMVNSNVSFPLTVKLAGGPEVLAKLGVLGIIAKMKKDLDAFVLEAQEHFFSNETPAHNDAPPAIAEAPASKALPNPTGPATPVDASVMNAVFDGI